MRGTTLNVPSFWMLACTRSLMKRASRSSSYCLPQRVLRSEARPILLGASSRPLASAAKTAETNGARHLPLADDQLLVHAALLVDVFDLLVLIGDRIARPHHREVDAHYF